MVQVCAGSPVRDAVAVGELQMLQSVQVRQGASQTLVCDPGTAAQRQVGETAAVKSHGRYAVIADLWQHGEREALEHGETQHLEKQRPASQYCTMWSRRY